MKTSHTMRLTKQGLHIRLIIGNTTKTNRMPIEPNRQWAAIEDSNPAQTKKQMFALPDELMADKRRPQTRAWKKIISKTTIKDGRDNSISEIRTSN